MKTDNYDYLKSFVGSVVFKVNVDENTLKEYLVRDIIDVSYHGSEMLWFGTNRWNSVSPSLCFETEEKAREFLHMKMTKGNTKMVKNKIYIDVQRVQTLRIEVSEETGFDVPDDMIGFAEFYKDINDDSYSLATEADWEEADVEYRDIKVSIKK